MAKETKNPGVKLGQEAFVVVTTDGEVERTVVGALEPNGYTFLNGLYSSRRHSFDLDEAIAAAQTQIKDRQDKLRAELRALERRRRHLQSVAYRDKVLGSTYKAVDLRPTDRRGRTRHLKRIVVPKSYLSPGDRVYTIISPRTGVLWEVQRPYPHFVLEVVVQTVCFVPDGSVHYSFATPFVVAEVYTSKSEAVTVLQSRSEPGVLESVPFVSYEEGKKLEVEDDLPF